MTAIVVMFMVLFLGSAAAATDFENGLDLLYYGGGIAVVILAGSVAMLIFQRVHQNEMDNEQKSADDKAGTELIGD